MRSQRLIPLFAFLFLCQVNAFSQEPATSKYVYLVSCSGSPHYKGRVIQTGFRAQGTKGIITALHGVLGATSITAQNSKNDVLVGLTIYSVDIDNDIALLSSKELRERSDDGLTPKDDLALTPGETLKVLGHPSGIELYEKTVTAGNPILKRLTTLIPPASARAFEKRKSPYEGINVLNIEGNLVAGDSGAPVLDSRNRVAAIVDGGLLGGIAAISWAIPIQSIVWKDASVSRPTLNELARIDPTSLFAYTTTSKSIGLEGIKSDPSKAISLQEANRLFVQGGQLFKQGQWAKASESFQHAINKNPQNAEYYFWLGYSLSNERKLEEAEEAFRAAVDLLPDNARFNEMLGYTLLYQQKFKEAETSFRASLRFAQGNASLYCGLGHALYWQQKRVEAMDAFKEGIRQSNTDIECQHFLGHAYLEVSKWKEAEILFRQLIKSLPTKAEFHDHLGDALAWQAKWKEAEAAYREASKLEPGNQNYDMKAKQAASQQQNDKD